ncbi:DNA polymerase III subunit alpha [Candidatus Dependentiae bacterium]
MSKHFTHLHLHTDYSLLDGAITLDKLVTFGTENNLKSLAISDHGNVFGAVKFFQKAKKAGIKPILGMEAYITEDTNIKDIKKRYYHLLLLVKNEKGYKNLCKLISYSFKEGFYFRPRIDYKILQKHSEGLIASTACLGGHIPQLIINGQHDQAEEKIAWFLDVFGKENFFLEVQPADQEEQKILNTKLYELNTQKNIELITTCDSHYLCSGDREAHELLLAIQTHDKIDNPDRYTFGDCRVHLRTEAEMLQEFKDHEQAIYNTGKIADMCNFDFQTDKLFFPKFEIPETYTPDEYFQKLCKDGLEQLKKEGRIPQDAFASYEERLEQEMSLIMKMGFVGYFLIVGDFIQWAKANKIPVGPGRGSAAGSIVSWSLQITNLDPIKYNLLFERFLNPERITMPDIDIDFCIEGRDVVINYVRDKYGHENVCQIITFGTMLAKGVIKDAARSLGISFEDSNAITKLIPDQLKITLKEAIEQEPKLQELIDSNPKIKKLFDLAFKLEGLTRHASKHAAGIVISPEAIDEVLPVYIPAKSDELVTQYAMTELESLGFLKIDFLGLKNLTLIDKAVKLIKKNHGVAIDIDALPLDDKKTFELLCEGNTSGVFQLESEGIKELLRKLQPGCLEDIIAVNALYRPGPLGSGMVDDFVERKHGRQEIKYLFDALEPILKPTYGVIVYQEQVMHVASAIAGFSLGQSDILRRAMGKKKVDVMAEQKKLFLEGATKKEFDETKSAELFDLMAYFAGYGFNKSHSAAYAMIAYQTAFLKANFPAEFMACLISLEASNADKMAFYLEETKNMGLQILPPNINTSEIDFSVVEGNILFGLQGIKGVGLAALKNIIAQQEKKPFEDLLHFCKRIDLRTANKRVIENLIYAGAFDTLPGNRAQQQSELAHIMEIAVEYKKAQRTGQMDLFGRNKKKKNSDAQELHGYQPLQEWSDKEKLEKEKEVMGFYLSAHPLDTYKKQLKRLNLSTFSQALEQSLNNNQMQEIITIGCGLLKNKKEILTKKGDKMAFVQLEDASATAEIIVFPRVFAKVSEWLNNYDVFVVKGAVDSNSEKKCKIKANDMVPIELLLAEWPFISSASFALPNHIEEETIQELRKTLISGKIPLNFIFHENGKRVKLVTKERISLDNETVEAIEQKGIEITLRL